MSKTLLKPQLEKAFAEFRGRTFTVGQITDHYMNLPECLHAEKKSARQFVYRNMKRLMKAGALVKKETASGHPLYCFKTSIEPTEVSPQKTPVIKQDTEELLRDRLDHYRTEMLTALGETEEYEALHRDFPDLVDETRQQFEAAKEHSTILLGKIKAVENLLSAQGDNAF